VAVTQALQKKLVYEPLDTLRDTFHPSKAHMSFDLIIKNGTIVDGSGQTEPYRADVGIQGEQISSIGDLSSVEAADSIDATGLIVAPGFIDVHVHGEIALLGGPDQFGEVRQGITTQLMAPDGFGWARLRGKQAEELWEYTKFGVGDVDIKPDWPTIDSYLALFDRTTPSNVCPQVPHCAVRVEVMGWDARPATEDELAKMADITREWMEAGACALNMGLDYQPTANADFHEMVTLCKVAAEYDGVYAAHLRYHILGREKAWRETTALARAAGIPVHVSHERVDDETAALLDEIDRDGDDLTFESYLYAAGMTHMTMMLPMELQEGSPSEVLNRLENPDVRATALPEMKNWLGRCDQVVGFTRSGRYIGERLIDIAERAKKAPEAFAYDLILEEDGYQGFIFPWQVPVEEAAATLERTIVHPRMMVASDGLFNVAHSHPRSQGCFARVLGEFVREKGLVSLKEAVYKMSGFPAERFRLGKRGRLIENYAAEIAVFDQETVAAQSTYENPSQGPIGIPHVIVNGVPVIRDGSPTPARPGKVISRS
jgi:N-acyl-D-amino-acid deacylase